MSMSAARSRMSMSAAGALVGVSAPGVVAGVSAVGVVAGVPAPNLLFVLDLRMLPCWNPMVAIVLQRLRALDLVVQVRAQVVSAV